MHNRAFWMPFIPVFMVSGVLWAASGRITGVVTDAVTDNPLPGANVVIEGTAIGASTNMEGFYRIQRVPPGTYTLVVTYIGYKTEKIPVKIGAHQKVNINAGLSFNIVEGEQITITAQREGQAAAINQQVRSNTIMNVVSSDRIRELPDENAAESVGRLPGVAVRRSGGEGRRVNIRGLSPKFNSITVDGERIPATGQGRDLFTINTAGPGSSSSLTDDRSVDLSMISSEALGGIKVLKALTPDRDADAIGGAVDFVTGKAPQGPKIRLNALGGYTGYHGSFNNYKLNATISNRFLDDRLGVLFSGMFQRADRSSDRQTVNWTWKGEVVLSSVDLDDRIEARDRQSVNLNLDYEWGEHSTMMWTNMYSRSNRDVINRRMRLKIGSNGGEYSSSWRKPEIYFYSSNVKTAHQTDLFDIDWGLNYTATFDENDFSYGYEFDDPGIFQSLDFVEEEGPFEASNNATIDLDAFGGVPWVGGNSRRQDKNMSAQINLKRQFAVNKDVRGYLKTGLKYRLKDRRFTSSGLKVRGTDFLNHFIKDHPDYKVVRANDLAMSNFLDAYDPGDFFNGQHPFPVTLDHKQPHDMYNQYKNLWRDQVGDGLDNYSADEKITAGYVQTKMSYKRRVTFLGGARYEYADNVYTAIKRDDITEDYYDETVEDLKGTFNDTTDGQTYGEWFPQFHLKFDILQDKLSNKGLDLRFAATRTLSRPDYLMLSPKYHKSNTNTFVERGNPDLKPTTAWSYDAFVTAYSKFGLFTAGVFYKELRDVAFLYARKSRPEIDGEPDRYTVIDPQNSDDLTRVKGLEFEIQANMTWLPNPFDGIVFYGNYSTIRSEAWYPWTYTEMDPKTYKTKRIYTTRKNQLPGQANNIANVALGYEKGRFSGRISYYFQDRTLDWLGENEEMDGWVDKYGRLDLSATLSITRYLMMILNVNNINNRHDRSLMGIHNYVNSESIYGTRAEFGLRVDF